MRKQVPHSTFITDILVIKRLSAKLKSIFIIRKETNQRYYISKVLDNIVSAETSLLDLPKRYSSNNPPTSQHAEDMSTSLVIRKEKRLRISEPHPLFPS